MQQAADVDKLQQTLKNLTESSKKHSKQLSAKQRSLVEAQAQAEAGKEMSGRELKALNTELAATKTALEEVRTREKEVSKEMTVMHHNMLKHCFHLTGL